MTERFESAMLAYVNMSLRQICRKSCRRMPDKIISFLELRISERVKCKEKKRMSQIFNII